MFMTQGVSCSPPPSRDPLQQASPPNGSPIEPPAPPHYSTELYDKLRSRHTQSNAGNGKTQPADPAPPSHKPSKKPILFRPRTSILDYTELMYHESDRMRGFVTCFWAIVGAFLASQLSDHWEATGEVVSTQLLKLLLSKGVELVLSDACLVVSAGFVVPFVWAFWAQRWGVDPGAARSMALQAIAEAGWLGFWYYWQMSRGWPWVQRCFFALHTLVNWMKVHSYLSTNRQLAIQHRRANSADEKEKDGRGNGFPSNLTLSNYAMFQLIPTLVYELEYPRTERIRWGYVCEKLLGTAGIFAVFYVVVAHTVVPHLEKMPQTGVALTVVHLMGPMATCWLLFFFITFDSICNGFAELTRFADRRFYDDWWNARGLDEFSRKWNRPVHMFLTKHVYVPIKSSAKTGGGAMGATFLFSSLMHEATLAVACRRWTSGAMFFFQMSQVPIIFASNRIPWRDHHQAFRNWMFWIAMVVGQPLLLCIYTYAAFVAPQNLQAPALAAAMTNSTSV